MRSTKREAKKYQYGDSGWSASKRSRKAFRQMALTPDEESPRHRKKRKKKRAPKHVHEWDKGKRWDEGGLIIYCCLICGRTKHEYRGKLFC